MTWVRLAGLSGFLAVALGAFGAHGLEERLIQNGTAETWETAVLYHAWHSVALLLLALRPAQPRGPLILFGVGIFIFSGSLYLLSITGIRWLGAITPVGGICLLAGWLWLVIRPPIGQADAGSGA